MSMIRTSTRRPLSGGHRYQSPPRLRRRPVRVVSAEAQGTWRPLAVVACLVGITAAALLYANHSLAGDLFWLLAAGRFVSTHGAAAQDPFLTLSHGGHWYNQQWLSEWLIFQVQRLGGIRLVSFAYALLLAGTLAPLAWACRRKSLGWTLAAWLLFAGSAVCVLQPRAAGFSLVAFAAALVIVQAAERRRRLLLFLPPLFALWANLHGAFIAGLLLVGLLALAAALERRPGRLPRVRLKAALPLAAAGVAAVPALLLTPLGDGLVDYMRSIGSNSALPLLTNEWLPTWEHPPALALLIAFAAFAAWLWHRAPRPRPPAAAIVAVGFAIFALTAARQAVWLGPVALYLVRVLAPAGVWRIPRRLAIPGAVLAVAGLALWWMGVAPQAGQANLMTAGADYAATHRPAEGRTLMPSGTGSYMLWRHPDVPVVVDGRLERYSAGQLLTAYRLLDGSRTSLRYLDRWRIGAVLTRNRHGAEVLQRHGFRLRARVGGGYYLVRERPLSASASR